jgi:hypothetical protein
MPGSVCMNPWDAEGRWALTCADITHLPFADEHFDVVICSEVPGAHSRGSQGHAGNRPRMKKGGLLAASVPRRWPEKNLLDAVQGIPPERRRAHPHL